MSVTLATNLKKEKIIMGLDGNIYDSLNDFKNHNPKGNGQELFSDSQTSNENQKNRKLPEQGVVGPTNVGETPKGGTDKKTDFEQIRLAILDSDLSDKDKVFMTMLLKDKTREDALTAILTSPLKDSQKVNLMRVI